MRLSLTLSPQVAGRRSPPWSLAVALDLFEAGVALMRQSLCRQFPAADDQDIARGRDCRRNAPPLAETRSLW